MIVLKKEISQNTFIAVWKIEEPEEFFYNTLILLPDDLSKIKEISLQKLRLQKLACRMALAKLLGANKTGITYSATGQPQLKDHYISFSHTENMVAVALSNLPVGIDIEDISPRIVPLYPRFMSEKEIAECDVNNLQDVYYYWCAKEAMYKWFAQKKLDFIEDLYVDKNNRKGFVCNHSLNLFDFYSENKKVVVCC